MKDDILCGPSAPEGQNPRCYRRAECTGCKIDSSAGLQLDQLPGVELSHVFYLSPRQAHQLIDAAAPHLQLLVYFMLLSGACEIGEAVYVNWEDIDLDEATVRFHRAHGIDEVPLHYRLVRSLREHHPQFGAVFRGPDGYPYVMTPRPACAIKTAFNSARRRARLFGITIRDLWVTAAVWQLALTRHMPPKQRLEHLANTSGWRDRRTLAKFGRIADTELQSLASDLEEVGVGDDW